MTPRRQGLTMRDLLGMLVVLPALGGTALGTAAKQ